MLSTKMRLVGMLLCMLAGCAGASAPAQPASGAAPAPPADTTTADTTTADTATAAQAGLTIRQAVRLRALGVPVAVPSHVPDGFAVDTVHTRPGAGGDSTQGPTYAARYTTPRGACFVIETATGGLGGPASPPDRRRVDPPLFPAAPGRAQYVFWTGAAPERPHPPRSLFSSWLKQGRRFYRLTSGRLVAQDCRRIAPAVAARVVASLRWLVGTAPRASDPFDFSAYRLISNRSIKVSVAGSETPTQTATRGVLDRLGLPPGENVPLPKKLKARAGGDGQANVLVTYTDLKDDAVAGRRYLLRMYAYQKNWVLSEIGVQYRCRRGPEDRRQRWSKALCP